MTRLLVAAVEFLGDYNCAPRTAGRLPSLRTTQVVTSTCGGSRSVCKTTQ